MCYHLSTIDMIRGKKMAALTSTKTSRRAHPDKTREYSRRYHEAHLEKARESSRRYREAHPDRARESSRESDKRWRATHLEQERDRSRRWYKDHLRYERGRGRLKNQKLKIEVLSHYSGGTPRCVMCEESRLVCLSIDHIKGGGNKHMRDLGIKVGIYRWLKVQNYPGGYQVLCMNCQFIKRAENKECYRGADKESVELRL